MSGEKKSRARAIVDKARRSLENSRSRESPLPSEDDDDTLSAPFQDVNLGLTKKKKKQTSKTSKTHSNDAEVEMHALRERVRKLEDREALREFETLAAPIDTPVGDTYASGSTYVLVGEHASPTEDVKGRLPCRLCCCGWFW
jgi:hypothetical protein